VDERALALMLGIDRAGGGDYRVTVQIPVARGPGTEPTSGGSVRIMTEVGPSVEGALLRVSRALYRSLELGQLKVIVVGAGLAREGLDRFDWLWRSRRIPGVTFLAVARETAAEVVAAETPLLAIPALFLYHQLKTTHATDDNVVPVYRWQALRNVVSPLEDLFLPGVTAHRYGLNVAGVALFRQGRLVGWLDDTGPPSLNRLLGWRFDGVLVVPGAADRPAAVRITGGGSRYGVRTEDHGLTLWAEVTVEGEARESGVSDVLELERRGAAVLMAETAGLIRQLQSLGTDPAGFGERLRRQHPGHPAVTSAAAWRAAYARAGVAVRARVRLRTPGYVDGNRHFEGR
jgi:spore germination protein KC